MSFLLEEQTVDGDIPTKSGHFADDYDRSLTGTMSFAKREEPQFNAFGDRLKGLISKTKDVLDGSDERNEKQGNKDLDDARKQFLKGKIEKGKSQLSKAIGDFTQAGYTHVQKMDKVCPVAAEYGVDYKDCRTRYPELYASTGDGDELFNETLQSIKTAGTITETGSSKTLKTVMIVGGSAVGLGILALVLIKVFKKNKQNK